MQTVDMAQLWKGMFFATSPETREAVETLLSNDRPTLEAMRDKHQRRIDLLSNRLATVKQRRADRTLNVNQKRPGRYRRVQKVLNDKIHQVSKERDLIIEAVWVAKLDEKESQPLDWVKLWDGLFQGFADTIRKPPGT